MFKEQLRSIQSELRAVRAERDSLKEIGEQQVSASFSDRKNRKGSCTVSDVSDCYVGLATKFLSELSACCARETSELCSFSTVPIRRWSSRAYIVTKIEVWCSFLVIFCCTSSWILLDTPREILHASF